MKSFVSSKETFAMAAIRLHHLLEIQNGCRLKGKCVVMLNIKLSQSLNSLSPNLSLIVQPMYLDWGVYSDETKLRLKSATNSLLTRAEFLNHPDQFP